MLKTNRKILIAVVMFMLGAHSSQAQDGHYWTEQFGTRSMLLNGAVIGSVEDLGAVYYNPARMSQFETPAFVISAKVYEYKKTTIKDGLGDDIDLKRSSFGGGPSLVSGTFKLKFLKKHKFAYAFLSRSRFDENFSFRIEDFGDFVEAFDGEEYFSGEISISKKTKDEWIGGSWSYAISQKLSVGLSGFYSSKDNSANLELQLQALSQDNETGIYREKRSYNFKTQSLLGKAGLSWQSKNLTAGLTITTPKLQGTGEGRTSYETFLAGIDTTGDGTNDDIYIINNQDNLDAKHKTPLSIGIGTGIKIGRS